jgi:tyrosyl-tRNA synthetase
MNFIQDLEARGLVAQSSADIEKVLGTKRTVYLGVDPSADSMHAGNLLVVLMMKRLAQAGHSIVLLVGGGTGMIGDPREVGERPLADVKTVARNKKALKSQIQGIVGSRVRVVDNADWLLKIKLVEFLRDIGKHFTINDLIKRDIIKRRLDDPNESISYTEFAYALLQGYDYLVLNQKYKVDLQIGATDQWTNILSGVDLIRKKLGKEAYAIVTPLVTEANGKKFGKSEGNAVWLDPKKTSPYEFYQFWYKQSDANVEQYLNFFTFMPVSEIQALMHMHQAHPERRLAQQKLAEEVTMLVHGKTEMEHARKISDVQFGGASIDTLSIAERKVFEASVVQYHVAPSDTIVSALVNGSLVSSKGEARRLMDGKGIKLNGEVVSNDRAFTDADFVNGVAQLQKGKSDKLRILK